MENGRLSDEQIDTALGAEAERAQREKFGNLWNAFGAPWLRRQKEFADSVLDGTVNPEGPWVGAVAQAGEAAADGQTVALIGPRGTGKTTMAVLIARSFCERGQKPDHGTAWDLFAEFKESYRNEGESERGIMRRLGTTKLLILDELRERGETDWEDRTLVRLIDFRYGAKLPTILIANLAREAMAESLGVSICERIVEAGTVIEATWPSFRAKEGGE